MHEEYVRQMTALLKRQKKTGAEPVEVSPYKKKPRHERRRIVLDYSPP